MTHIIGLILPKLVPWVNISLVITLAYVIADLSLRWIHPPTAPPPVLTQPLSGAQPTSTARNYTQMANWALFGSPVEPTPAPVVVVNAPETRLNVRLAGIFHSNEPDGSPLALIAVDNRTQQVFKTGDRLNDGTRISQILTDRVLLDRNGQIEALSLPRETVDHGLSNTRSATTNGSATAPHTIDATTVAAELRRQVSNNPDALLDLAFATPYFADNQFAGLRLDPGRQPHLFNQLGLQSGDIVIALNGRRLTNPNQGMQLLQELLSAERLEVQVQRNGRNLPLTFILSR